MALDANKQVDSNMSSFKIVEFIISGVKNHYFGINVAKVKEIIKLPKIIKIPDSHPSISGTANVRGDIITIINLPFYLGYATDTDKTEDNQKVIITLFSSKVYGFIIDDVTRIHSVKWSEMEDYEIASDFNLAETVLGAVKISDRLIQLLDFEKILYEIYPYKKQEIRTADEDLKSKRQDKKVYVIEDSLVVRKIISETLKKAGYEVESFEEVVKALEKINEVKPEIIITDLEMAGADGIYLTKMIRKNQDYDSIPIIIFTSIENEENRKYLLGLGANAFLGKSDLGLLLNQIDKYLLGEMK